MIRRTIAIVLAVALALLGAAPAAAQGDPPATREELRELFPPLRLFPEGSSAITAATPRTVDVCPGVEHEWVGAHAAIGRIVLGPGEYTFGIEIRSFDDERQAQRALVRYHRARVDDCARYTVEGSRAGHRAIPSPFGDDDAVDASRVARFRLELPGPGRVVGQLAVVRVGRIVFDLSYFTSKGERDPRSIWLDVVEETIDRIEAAGD